MPQNVFNRQAALQVIKMPCDDLILTIYVKLTITTDENFEILRCVLLVMSFAISHVEKLQFRLYRVLEEYFVKLILFY